MLTFVYFCIVDNFFKAAVIALVIEIFNKKPDTGRGEVGLKIALNHFCI